MTELIYEMKCPNCDRIAEFLFSGSGRKGTCMNCGHNLPRDKRNSDYEGRVLSYM